MKYRISRRANQDLESICDRIAFDNPAAAFAAARFAIPVISAHA